MSTAPSSKQEQETANKAPFTIDRIDHIVLQCADVQQTIEWYTKYMGMSHTPFPTPTAPRHSLSFGSQTPQKLNLHHSAHPFKPHAHHPLPGTQDLCFVLSPPTTAEQVLEYWKKEGLELEEGGEVVERVGARGGLRSVYTRDPDGNLIEVSNYV